MLNTMVISSHFHRQVSFISLSKVRYNHRTFRYILGNNHNSMHSFLRLNLQKYTVGSGQRNLLTMVMPSVYKYNTLSMLH